MRNIRIRDNCNKTVINKQYDAISVSLINLTLKIRLIFAIERKTQMCNACKQVMQNIHVRFSVVMTV